mmetsp:Transcript_23213/g.38380  ORF Transcript_23213/g.38380 Transcript_23213/m.38380 type:complete len:278 (+) Transcript_23213:151-984(+)|eukprot:CAMPEP_0119329604 /NCGR_PEP_ID=MMETSP1333-20130426/76230_1 /TAXON_ID=418940 /ORGANISM="Scyphosphaera apsteinii, Strain RCC1455" /LENGTH=277 /DNA_ID=CAMNT_0007338763 /DNA_START=159 /DNA_END=992 /DNA_ORIENTATION=+
MDIYSGGSNAVRCVKEAFLQDSSQQAAAQIATPVFCGFGCGSFGDTKLNRLCRSCHAKLYPDVLSRLHVDHLVYVVPGPLEDAMAAFQQRTGVMPALGGKHEGLGTHNALVSLGSGAYFELLAHDPAQPSPPRTWLGMEGIDPMPHLATWATARDNLAAVISAARATNYDPGDVTSFSRLNSSGKKLAWQLSFNHWASPLPGGGLVPFLISWESRSPAADAPSGIMLKGLRAEAPDPSAIAPMLDAIGVDAASFLRHGSEPRLIATLATPNGVVEIR